MGKKNFTNEIKNLIKYLPSRDIPIGYKLLEKRDFESLKDLVDSAIQKIENNLSGNPEKIKEEYTKINMELLESLKVEVDKYLDILNGENYYDEDDNDYDDYLNLDEFEGECSINDDFYV